MAKKTTKNKSSKKKATKKTIDKKKKKTSSKAQKVNLVNKAVKKETEEIKEASIAKFMRKRTQLVGFDYGLFKHTQYAVEFVDNALDAIEKFQWDQKNALQEIRHNFSKVSYKFSRFLNEIDNINDMFENDGPKSEIVKRLRSVIQKSGEMFNNILSIFNILQESMSISDEEFEEQYIINFNKLEEMSKLKVTVSTLEEVFANFISDYMIVKDTYINFEKHLDELENDPKFMFTLNKQLELEQFSYLKYKESNGEQLTLDENGNENKIESMKKLLETSFTSDIQGPSHEQLEISSDKDNELDVESKSTNEIFDENERDNKTTNIDSTNGTDEDLDDEQARELRKLKKTQEERLIEVKNLTKNLNDFIRPVKNFINNEPLVIVKLDEYEAPDVFQEKGKEQGFLYKFQIFDNGTGMRPNDLRKYGKYLASSKSQKLKQTRGSQGFGSPSAFSDAQNTTGRPITVVSKHFSQEQGEGSVFYTTEKNTKVYVIEPEKINCDFIHGTYCQLEYLNKKYKRGYVDEYIEKAAMMNSHVTLIYIDPYGEEHIYPRRVQFFPKEPKFAMPHPSSVKLGDFQDLLRSSTNHTITAFLTENFVRMSSSLAKNIVNEAEFEIERELKYLNLDIGFISVLKKKSDQCVYIREEQRIYGRSPKPRPKIIAYLISSGDLKDRIWEKMQLYNLKLKERENIEKEIKKLNQSIVKLNDKKQIKAIEKEIKKLDRDISARIKDMQTAKKEIKSILKDAKFTDEIEDSSIVDNIVDTIKELQISKTKPSQLTQKQTEFLYMAFKNQNYMSPPTDTAIPVGETALETAIIKQYGLTISNRVDFFGIDDDTITSLDEIEIELVLKKLLSKFSVGTSISSLDEITSLDYDTELTPDVYDSVILDLDLTHTAGDDFVAAHTRKPTSGKGLAFVVEAVMAYSSDSKKIPTAKKASQVVARYVNRTPKLRDNSDCALWMGVQNVNWKSYKVVDTFDNGIPKGNYVLYINCSGPYTHLMFKSQSKNALAEDEVLLKEVKMCLEVIGRKLRKYMSKKEIRQQRKDRTKRIQKNIPLFVDALYNIAKQNPKYKNLNKTQLKKKIEEILEIESDPRRKAKETENNKDLDENNVKSTKTLEEHSEQIHLTEGATIQQTLPVESSVNARSDSNTKQVATQVSKLTSTQGSAELDASRHKNESITGSKSTAISGKKSTVKKSLKKTTKKIGTKSVEITKDLIKSTIKQNPGINLKELIKKMKITSVIDAKYLSTQLKILVNLKKEIKIKRTGDKSIQYYPIEG